MTISVVVVIAFAGLALGLLIIPPLHDDGFFWLFFSVFMCMFVVYP